MSGLGTSGSRPYAAILLATASLIQDTENSRTVLALGLGVTGPIAMGQTVQNGFHDIIRAGDARGWHTQGPNQPVVQLTAERTWRLQLLHLDLGPLGRLEADVLPSATLSAGLFRVYAQAGGVVRIGEGLQSDFGPSRNRPDRDRRLRADPTHQLVRFRRGLNGQAVAWDETLDGEPWTASPACPPTASGVRVGVRLRGDERRCPIYRGARVADA